MIQRKQLDFELQSLQDLRTLVESYQEIASIRMRRVKSSVLQNRAFLEDLQQTYKDVYTAYLFEQQHGSRKIKQNWSSLLATKDRNVAILLSSNTQLYGDVVKEAFNLFYDYIKTNDVDVVVAGKVGVSLLKEKGYTGDYKVFELSDSAADAENIRKLFEYIIQYKGINVFHGKFRNILTQEAVNSTIYDKMPENTTAKTMTHFLFEPTLDEVVKFFQTEIVASIFEQTTHESNLSKFASRMISLDFSVDNIGKNIKQMSLLDNKVKHSYSNKKQLGVISGIALWRENGKSH